MEQAAAYRRLVRQDRRATGLQSSVRRLANESYAALMREKGAGAQPRIKAILGLPYAEVNHESVAAHQSRIDFILYSGLPVICF